MDYKLKRKDLILVKWNSKYMTEEQMNDACNEILKSN